AVVAMLEPINRIADEEALRPKKSVIDELDARRQLPRGRRVRDGDGQDFFGWRGRSRSRGLGCDFRYRIRRNGGDGFDRFGRRGDNRSGGSRRLGFPLRQHALDGWRWGRRELGGGGRKGGEGRRNGRRGAAAP